jgi:hypothetical protein
MEENVQKYELEQDNKTYIVTTSIINNKYLKICCFPNKQKYGYQNQFSLNDLVNINKMFLHNRNLKEIQDELEKCILDQKVSLLHNRTIFDINFYITNNSITGKVSIRLNYQYHNSNQENKIKNHKLLKQIEQDTSTIKKEQDILKEKIDQILSSNFVYDSIINNYQNNGNNKMIYNNNFSLNNNSSFNNKNNKSDIGDNKSSKSEKTYIESSILNNLEELKIIESKLRKLVKGVKYINCRLLYKASIDSDKAEIFHRKCRGKENTVILVETDKNKRFGGFTSQNWDGDRAKKSDQFAFIFSLDKLKIYEIKNGANAIECYNNYGPIFSGYFLINDNSFKNGGRTFLKGNNYTTNENFELTGSKDKFGVKEIEVFQIIFE